MASSDTSTAPLVGVIMGSASDWDVMRNAVDTLEKLGIPCERHVISAHRTPARIIEYAGSAKERGLKCIIAAAGMAAHLAGVTAALTELPVLGVPMESPSLKGMDSLLSTVQMPGGIPVATFAIGKAGAVNAALFAVAMMAVEDPEIAKRYSAFRAAQSKKVAETTLP